MSRSPSSSVLADLEARGLVHDTTDRERLAARLASSPVTVYCGFDPTADSLHVGHLLGVLALRRLQLAGHRPLALIGGVTGMIGDPSGRSGGGTGGRGDHSGRSAERPVLGEKALQANVAALTAQIGRLLQVDGSRGSAILVDNASWTGDLRLPEFLRDVGRHVTVNAMLAKESVRARLEGPEGLSFTEFSYMLVQAHDYLWLHEHHGCDLQVGGSDQWGNITAGIDLIRRRTGDHVHGLTWPLLTRADGTKFGKSEGGNVWLDARRTSPYAFFQHWMQVDDDDVRRFLLQLTLLDVAEVDAVSAAHAAAPERRQGQRRLASELTTIVHGAPETAAAQAATTILFGGDPGEVPAAAYRALEGEVPTTTVDAGRLADGLDLVVALAETGLSTSRSDARRSISQGAVYVNDRRVGEGALVLSPADLRHHRWILLRRGRRHHHLLRVGPE